MTAFPSDLAVRVQDVSKRYRIGVKFDREDSLLLTLGRGLTAPIRNFRELRRLRVFDTKDEPDVIWALRDVSFELRQGEVLGVVGRNGAGKSTLLKILSRVTEPTSGYAQLRGRTASLLEVGTGFHPDLTGRENVFLNGTMHGMTRRDVEARFDEIVEFAELEQFMETPIKRYSSGMYVRLAFSVAAHLDPDILLTDEVLAVGDMQFQQKCVSRMQEVASGGRTVIFVSHNHAAVSSLCTRGLWLDHGTVQADGPVDVVLGRYRETIGASGETILSERADRQGDGRMRIRSISFRSRAGAVVGSVKAGEDLDVVLGYECDRVASARNVTVSLIIDSALGARVTTLSNDFTGDVFGELPASGELVCRVRELPLNDGTYIWSVKVRVGGGLADRIMDVATLTVDGSGYYASGRHPVGAAAVVLVDHEWSAREPSARDLNEALSKAAE
jgi:homopolymeric O-antigen transport system ATP-binding protein